MSGTTVPDTGESRMIPLREPPASTEPQVKIALRPDAHLSAEKPRSMDEWLQMTAAFSAVRIQD